ncbi:hypothetical protein ACFL2Q_12010, partial [Thermodesulfobacteriota bacterium]
KRGRRPNHLRRLLAKSRLRMCAEEPEGAANMKYEMDFLQILYLLKENPVVRTNKKPFEGSQIPDEARHILKGYTNATSAEIDEMLTEVKEWMAEIRAHSGPVSRRVGLEAIHLDKKIYSLEVNVMDLLQQRLEIFLQCGGPHSAPRDLFPIRVFKNGEKYNIIDGYHRWKAYEIRVSLLRHGKWVGPIPETDVELHTLPALVFEMPKRSPAKGRYLLMSYALEGKSIRQAVEDQCRQKAGLPAGRIAKLLKIDLGTALKYANPLLEKWKRELDDFIEQLKAEGLTQASIKEKCIRRWPWGHGISQASISRRMHRPRS